jgi:hemerythrin-like domain-containing protein
MNARLADASDMFAVHTMFRREFGLMSGLVRAVKADDERRVALVANHVALVSQVLHVHHSEEDRHIWPRLRARGTGHIAPIVALMEEQHEAIHQGLLNMKEALASWRKSASAETRDAFAYTIRQVVPVLNEHLTVEEECVVPLIEKYITAAEYALIAQEASAEMPPDKLPPIFGMMMYETAPAVIDTIVAQMPVELRPFIKDVAAKAYAAYAYELYGTTRPPRVTGPPAL